MNSAQFCMGHLPHKLVFKRKKMFFSHRVSATPSCSSFFSFSLMSRTWSVLTLWYGHRHRCRDADGIYMNIYEYVINAPSTAHGARSAAATELRRSCDGVTAATESLLRRSCADQLRRAHSAQRVRDGADAAATGLMLRAALLRRSRCCDGAAQTSSVALILRVAWGASIIPPGWFKFQVVAHSPRPTPWPRNKCRGWLVNSQGLFVQNITLSSKDLNGLFFYLYRICISQYQ